MKRLDGHQKTKCVQSNLSHANYGGASVLVGKKNFFHQVTKLGEECGWGKAEELLEEREKALETRRESLAGKRWKHLKSQGRNTRGALRGAGGSWGSKMGGKWEGLWQVQQMGKEMCPEKTGKGRPQGTQWWLFFPGKKQHLSPVSCFSLKCLRLWCYGLEKKMRNTQ